MSFADLKKASSQNFDKLKEKLEKMDSGKSNYTDDRFWQPTVDSAGNGYAIIRFLPPPEGEEFPFVRLWKHAFKGPTGQWYIENSRSTLDINEPDPVMEYNNKLWNSVDSDDTPERKQAREQKRKLSYISNIYVVKDPEHPENEGKVFLYSYGKKIFDKIKDIAYPEFEDETPIDPFDFWKGANFKLKIRKVEGYRNYDKSEFDSPSPLKDSDEELEKIYNKMYSLTDLVAPDKFKPYPELKAKLERVLGHSIDDGRSSSTIADREEMRNSIPAAPEPTLKEKDPVPQPSVDTPVSSDDDDDDDDLDFFKKLTDD